MDSTGVGVSPSISLSEHGEYAAQISGKDVILHLNPTSSGFQDVEIVKVKESSLKFLKFSRASYTVSPDTYTARGEIAPGRRVLHASDARVLVWQLLPLQLHAEIESIEPGALNIDFGSDENEVIVFHAWNTRLTVYALDTGRSQVIKSPKFAHHNGFGYRPKTGQFAILLKPDAVDLLTIHGFRSYELINRAVLPTVDAQGLKWSPDGRWVAVWDAASAGTKVLVFTADGKLFRTYTGPPGFDDSFDLGVRGIEWSPVANESGASEYLAIGKVDGTVDILRCKTFSCSTTLSHVFQIDDNSPSIWRERYATADGTLEYAESSSSSAFSITAETSGPPRGVSIMAFSCDGNLLATVDQTRPNIVWIWNLESTAVLVSALVHEHPVRQAAWHPSKIQVLIVTANNAVAAVRSWTPDGQPSIIYIPTSRSDSGRYDVRWLSSQGDDAKFWFGTTEDYTLGRIEGEGSSQFKVLNTIKGKASTGSHSAVKDKAQHAVVLEKQVAERLNKDVQSYRLITVATLVDRLKINGSLARKALEDLEEKGQIKKVVGHSKLNIYTRAVTAE
ncbi:S25 ribosomal protein-domain-containing protein [Aspergillus novoparasiticus]|uniref:S25 ribosomal protein-domain-containing protein n=1 Tax=Aspergillus novoparasiticus TaxID=986946 RepID=A0A5N6F4N6_9EURO|nr:S25 ribosomal protein-domain-containing protein [Aspergillus novoparasiticus]